MWKEIYQKQTATGVTNLRLALEIQKSSSLIYCKLETEIGAGFY